MTYISADTRRGGSASLPVVPSRSGLHEGYNARRRLDRRIHPFDLLDLLLPIPRVLLGERYHVQHIISAKTSRSAGFPGTSWAAYLMTD
jgi:hypothetical protein